MAPKYSALHSYVVKFVIYTGNAIPLFGIIKGLLYVS